MKRALKIILAANLIVIAILAFVYPNLMVGPGKLIPGHKQLETDCFACHSPLLGVKPERCTFCHKPADIGRLTTKGFPITKPLTATPFHQKLASLDCMVCHSDHAGVKRFRKQGRFDHAMLERAMVDQCQTCHKAPSDSLHQQITGNCGQCHEPNRWAPATFDHERFFALDRDHTARCVTCHIGNDYRRYTCYGCHEHSLDKIRREHIEEGIRDFDNCVECHRSGNKHEILGGRGEGRGEHHGGHGRKEHDDD